MADVIEQRGMLRDVLYGVLGLGEGLGELMQADPGACAKMASAVVQAAKALMDLDGLRAPRPAGTPAMQVGDSGDASNGGNGKAAIDATAELAAKIARVGEDLRDRALSPGVGNPPVV